MLIKKECLEKERKLLWLHTLFLIASVLHKICIAQLLILLLLLLLLLLFINCYAYQHHHRHRRHQQNLFAYKICIQEIIPLNSFQHVCLCMHDNGTLGRRVEGKIFLWVVETFTNIKSITNVFLIIQVLA